MTDLILQTPSRTNHNQIQTQEGTRVPEILAPVGGMAQFFAALNSGADAVFLGLKTFNARARAENFSVDDLRSLVPLAHQYGMKVLVTLNILIKDIELKALIETLSDIEDVGVDAIIVQDLGVAAIAKKYFPSIRLHASTQMAVHNLAGVEQAMEWGFKRVVLARELTAQEIKRIRQSIPDNSVELEVFCHGSLCYSYPGLCFFSGAADARSGNRGECAYTCREPYKVVSEPGQGFLFSMKDLDTAHKLNLMVEAGVDTLKIEGRKKDAQYVSSVVKLYRKKLDDLFGKNTLRSSAPNSESNLASTAELTEDSIRKDLALSFQRGTTSFFFEGRYHENVIDLNSPSHMGIQVGTVEALTPHTAQIRLTAPLEVHDGVKLVSHKKIFHAKPQDGDDVVLAKDLLGQRYDNAETAFAIKNVAFKGRKIFEAEQGMLIDLPLADMPRMPQINDAVFKMRSAELKRRVEKLTKPPFDARLRPMRAVSMDVTARRLDDGPVVLTAKIERLGVCVAEESIVLADITLRDKGLLIEDIRDVLRLFGDEDIYVEEFKWDLQENFFIPRKTLKDFKKTLQVRLRSKCELLKSSRLETALKQFHNEANARPCHDSIHDGIKWTIKIDRIDYIAWIKEELKSGGLLDLKEVIFEPKKMYLNTLEPATFLEPLIELTQIYGLKITLALPTVVRAWDELVLKKWIVAASDSGVASFEIGNAGGLKLLQKWGLDLNKLEFSGDFMLYGLNRAAVSFWRDHGFKSICLSIEDDLEDMTSLMSHWPEKIEPVSIVYKDTPLFMAEACSLTALCAKTAA